MLGVFDLLTDQVSVHVIRKLFIHQVTELVWNPLDETSILSELIRWMVKLQDTVNLFPVCTLAGGSVEVARVVTAICERVHPTVGRLGHEIVENLNDIEEGVGIPLLGPCLP